MKKNGRYIRMRATGNSKSSCTGRSASENHDARAKRPLHKLRKLLCQDGDKTNGAACLICESVCQFGKIYLEQLQQNTSRLYDQEGFSVGMGLLDEEG